MVRHGVICQFIIEIDDAMRNLTGIVTITDRLEMLAADLADPQGTMYAASPPGIPQGGIAT